MTKNDSLEDRFENLMEGTVVSTRTAGGAVVGLDILPFIKSEVNRAVLAERKRIIENKGGE